MGVVLRFFNSVWLHNWNQMNKPFRLSFTENQQLRDAAKSQKYHIKIESFSKVPCERSVGYIRILPFETLRICKLQLIQKQHAEGLRKRRSGFRWNPDAINTSEKFAKYSVINSQRFAAASELRGVNIRNENRIGCFW